MKTSDNSSSSIDDETATGNVAEDADYEEKKKKKKEDNVSVHVMSSQSHIYTLMKLRTKPKAQIETKRTKNNEIKNKLEVATALDCSFPCIHNSFTHTTHTTTTTKI